MTGKGVRLFEAVLGTAMVACGILMLVALPAGEWRVGLIAIALLVVGGQAVWCAIDGRQSWLSRIGPLP